MALSSELVNQLQNIVGAGGLALDCDSLLLYGNDSSKLWPPSPAAIVFPKTAQHVQQIVRLANEAQIAVVPSGGRTGLSGGGVAQHGELVVSLEKLNNILEVDEDSGTIRCQAGVITYQLQQAASEIGLFYPVDFASSGSSHIGGNIATNAGGINVLRYGLTRDWVRGLTVVTGAGELLHLNNGLIKNNSGYDFRHLLIGSEGSLGIVCEATMALTNPPINPNVMLLGVNDVSFLPRLCAQFNQQLHLTVCEYFCETALTKVINAHQLQRPLASTANYYLLVEFEQVNSNVADQAMAIVNSAIKDQQVTDGVIASSITQAKHIWRLRENISSTLAQWQPYKNDIAVPPAAVAEFMTAVNELLAQQAPNIELVWFGHLGDGNMHLNLLKPDKLTLPQFKTLCQELSHQIAKLVNRFGGTVSAEHGVGLLKKAYLHYTRSEAEIELMRQVKKVFDPNGIMNPGKIFD